MKCMRKLTASTMIETLVAMTIIMISFGVVALLVINTSRNTSILKLNAFLLCEDVKSETLALKNYEYDELKYENMDIIKTIKKYKQSADLQILEIQAFSKNEVLIYETKLVIPVSDEKD